MLLIFIVVACAMALFKCRTLLKMAKPVSNGPTEVEKTIEGLTHISALQEGIIIEHSKTIDNLTKELETLKRKYDDISKE